jgi:hypothetical protein
VVLEIPAGKLSPADYRILVEDIKNNNKKEYRVYKFQVEATPSK